MQKSSHDPKKFEVKRVRRVVTGTTEGGQSCIAIDDKSRHSMSLMGIPGLVVTDLWRSGPVNGKTLLNSSIDPCQTPIEINPPVGGSVFRVTQFPPESVWRDGNDIGGVGRHPHMHSTKTLDYAIILQGRIWAVTDTMEVELAVGDVLIQQGTQHAWANRGIEPCLIAFVMIDAVCSN